MIKSSLQLELIFNKMKDDLTSKNIIHANETTVQVLKKVVRKQVKNHICGHMYHQTMMKTLSYMNTHHQEQVKTLKSSLSNTVVIYTSTATQAITQ